MSVFENSPKLQELHETLTKAQKQVFELPEEEARFMCSGGCFWSDFVECTGGYNARTALLQSLEVSIEIVERAAIEERIRQIDPTFLEDRNKRLERLRPKKKQSD